MGIKSIWESNFFKGGFKLVDKRLMKKRMAGLALGQLLSVMIAGTAIFSQLLVVRYGVNIPTSQSLLNYLLLCIYLIVLAKRGVLWETIKTKSIYFAPLALIDMEANYIVVKAYQYTTITSVMLLDCFTIPCVVVLSRIFLKTRFTIVHISAVALAIAGMVILVVSDLLQGESANGGSNPLLGDFLALASSVCYAISNVGQEATVKKFDRISYLAMIGLYGSIFCGIQMAILERNELATMQWNGAIVGYIIGFAICLFIMYSFAPMMMEIAGATVMNLSLLTSDIFGVIAAIFLFDRDLSWLYFLSFFVICSALVIYNLAQPHAKDSEIQNLLNNNQSTNNTTTIPISESSNNLLNSSITPGDDTFNQHNNNNLDSSSDNNNNNNNSIDIIQADKEFESTTINNNNNNHITTLDIQISNYNNNSNIQEIDIGK